MTPVQAEIVKGMARNGLKMSKTAVDMKYHYNTVAYHVDAIKRQTGKDPRDFYDMIQLLKEADVVLLTDAGEKYSHIMEPGSGAWSDDFGAVLNCAVRYCIGRQTYMPKLVMDVIRPLIPGLSSKTLWCFEQDIERANNYGADFDKEEWMRFLGQVKAELSRRDDLMDGE